jgi:hypothetical protein
MPNLVIVLAVLVSVTAAVRSTWSPCGLSMLSTITPVGERGRGARYATTAAWFVTGAVLGGATLGGAIAVLSVAVGALHLSSGLTLGAVVGAACLAAACDAGVARFHVPAHRRQVNERWLDQFRPWVYGAGFGWQIGVGLATYITSAAVYLTVVLGALPGSPPTAVIVGVVFGSVRGLAVLLGARLTSPAALRAFHRRFDRLAAPVRAAVVVVELVVASVAVGALWAPAAGVVAAAATSGLLAWVTRRTRVARL